MFQVGDHAILINGMFNDFHGVGWVRSVMTAQIGQEFVITEILREGIARNGVKYQSVCLDDLNGNGAGFVYDSAWLVPVEQYEFNQQALDDMFSEFG